MKRRGSAAQGGLLGWLGWAGLDAVGRLALMTGSTVIFSRLLEPRDFGVTALILTTVSFAAIFVGTPFEEALTQRRFVRAIHLRAALGVSWFVGSAILALSIVAGDRLALYYGEPDIGILLPVAMSSIFFSGHSDIVTALARRIRRFNDVAIATLAGHIIGIALSLLLAFAGYGLWALIAQRLLVVIARACILQWRIGFLITPAWSPSHVRGFGRFAGFSFLSRLTDNAIYLAFNNIVQALYGVSVLGQVNMAMRLIEPIRGAIVATGHNLAFSFFARASHETGRLSGLAEQVVTQSAFVTAPVFVGIAAVACVLVPLVAGPGWDEAVMITICLSLASAMAVPAGLVYTAFSATGRPEYSLLSLVTGFAAIVATLALCREIGPVSVGLSRIAADLVRVAFAIGLTSPRLDWPSGSRFRALVPALLLAAVMGLVVAATDALLPPSGLFLRLVTMVVLGITVYGLLVRVFARAVFDSLAMRIKPKSVT